MENTSRFSTFVEKLMKGNILLDRSQLLRIAYVTDFSLQVFQVSVRLHQKIRLFTKELRIRKWPATAWQKWLGLLLQLRVCYFLLKSQTTSDTVIPPYTSLYDVAQSNLNIKAAQSTNTTPPIATSGLCVVQLSPSGSNNKVGAKLVVIRKWTSVLMFTLVMK